MAKKFYEEGKVPEQPEIPAWEERPFNEETVEISPLAEVPQRKGKFVAIAGSEVIVDVNGNGERIPYVPEKHASLKAGDEIPL